MKKKWFCTFKHTEPLITAVEHDQFTACDKMPTAFNQNPQLILLKAFVIFKSVYGFVFRDFEDFIKQISVTQLFLWRILRILNTEIEHWSTRFIFNVFLFSWKQIKFNKTKDIEKKITVCFWTRQSTFRWADQCWVYVYLKKIRKKETDN